MKQLASDAEAAAAAVSVATTTAAVSKEVPCPDENVCPNQTDPLPAPGCADDGALTDRVNSAAVVVPADGAIEGKGDAAARHGEASSHANPAGVAQSGHSCPSAATAAACTSNGESAAGPPSHVGEPLSREWIRVFAEEFQVKHRPGEYFRRFVAASYKYV